MREPIPPDPHDDPVTGAAREAFGIGYLFPWQRLVIANILDAVAAVREAAPAAADGGTPQDDGLLRDEDGALRGRQIVLLPTGAGKSLCFQVPALLLDGPTLVIYPLLALMGDQERRMAGGGLDPALFRGNQSPEEREAQYARLEGRDGRPPARLVIANPEVLAGKALLDRIAARHPAHLAIDEAHCVSEWGDSFRPAYLELASLVERLDPPAVTAFTATASDGVLARVADILFGGRAHLVRGDTDRPNISYRVALCRAKDPALILEVARRRRPIVVFCSTRGGTEHAAELLRNVLDDRDIRFYHAGLQKDEKTEVESWFREHPRAILCTTCAWGMGVDKKDVRTVIHRDAPPTVEAYVQEAGRGGRDGTQAEAVLLWSPSDSARMAGLPDERRARAAVLAAFARGDRCRREILLEALGDPLAGSGAPDGQRIACSGCDVCEGTAEQAVRDEKFVTGYLERNQRLLSREEAVAGLHEAAKRLVRLPGGNPVWRRQDFAAIIAELEKEGRIRELARWPFRGKLQVVHAGEF